MPDLIIGGYVYIALPPLYKIVKGKKAQWVYTDQEKDLILEEYKNNKIKFEIQRYKGLGEMNPLQLRETTMDRKRRTLLKVSIPSGEEKKTARRVEDLMGRKPETRFAFIREHACFVSDLDI